MIRSLTTTAVVLVLGAFQAVAQVANLTVSTSGIAAANQQAPNTIVMGSGTAISYDSNALNSRPATPNTQYTVFPQIGINLERPRWDALINLEPGFSVSSANLPQYQAVSLTSAVVMQFRPSPRLAWGFSNSLISSTNPFNSLSAATNSSTNPAMPAMTAPLNYLPRTNLLASADVAYNLGPRTALVAMTSYNYLEYQHDNNLPTVAQPFQQSNSGQITLGISHSSSPRYAGSPQYVWQVLDSGPGAVRTYANSMQYSLQYNPRSSVHVSAMVGSEYLQTTYRDNLNQSNSTLGPSWNSAHWTWTGSGVISWTQGQNQFSASASHLPSIGTQYQGNVIQSLFNAGFHRKLARTLDFDIFAGYSMNQPISVNRQIPRLANNYLSTGFKCSRTIADHWIVEVAYWYLVQNQTGPGAIYSGDHNRVAGSLTYVFVKPLK